MKKIQQFFFSQLLDPLLDMIVGSFVSLISSNPMGFIVNSLTIVNHLSILKDQERQFIKDLIGYFQRNRAAVEKIFHVLSPRVKTRIAINYLGNMRIRGPIKRKTLSTNLGIRVPDVLFLEVTSRCNLHCEGCYSEIYRSSRQDLDMATLERVIDEAQQIGIYTTFLTGGEPLIRSKDVLSLARNFRGTAFGIFTNATLITSALAKEIELAANMFFFVSVDGLEQMNNRRRGNNVFKRSLKGMDLLREQGILFGSSTTTSRENVKDVMQDPFVELMTEKGCTYMAYLPYLPSGRGWSYDSRFLLTAEQRAWAHYRTLELRKKYPVSIFNSHLNFMGMCGGGGRILYVNTNGDVQPCGPVHFATDNVRDHNLREIVGSNLMRAYARREPVAQNPLKMCWVLDYPDELRAILLEADANPIDDEAISLIDKDLSFRRQHADTWHAIADEIWANNNQDDYLNKLEEDGVGKNQL